MKPERRFFLVPIAVAVYPAVYLAATNVGQFEVVELAIIIGALGALGGLTYGVLHLAFGRRSHASTVALVATLVNAWFFVSLMVSDMLADALNAPVLNRTFFVVGVLGLLTTGASWALLRNDQDRRALLRALSAFVYVIVGLSTLQLGAGTAWAAHKVRSSPFVARRLQPVVSNTQVQDDQRLPDIYLIILDTYANSTVLHERLGSSNEDFDTRLREFGFEVLKDGRSNYSGTSFSLASILSLDHVSGAGDSLGGAQTLGLKVLVENNRSVEFLKRLGYRTYFFPSQWVPSTRRDRRADVHFSTSERSFRSLAARSALAQRIWWRTVPGRAARALFGYELWYPEYDLAVLENIQQLPASSAPSFIFAHLMLTHEPYFLDVECRIPSLRPRSGGRDAYLNQVRCVNRLLLQTVAAITRRSNRPSVILLQADHGLNFKLISREWPGEDLEELRFAAYAAYRLPDGGQEALDPNITPVNLLRFVFSYYHGADLPPVSNDSYRE